MTPLASSLEVLPRLQAPFAAFIALLAFTPQSHRLPAATRRGLWIKLVVFYLITHFFLLLVTLGGAWLHAGLLLVGLAACRELVTVLLPEPEQAPYRVLAWAGSLAALLLTPSEAAEGPLLLAVLLATLALPVLRRQPAGCHAAVALTVLTVLLAGVLPLHLLRLRHEQGLAAAFLFLLIVLNDGFAEACGRLFGRRPFFQSISPHKTLEGALGGTAAALVGALLFQPLLPVPAWQRLLLGLVASVAGHLGDLIFSALKRSVGRKDFDSLLPSHGGVLDRFDSLWVAAPAFHHAYGALVSLSQGGGTP
jgi:phosphatidate cytidylyltransferase